MTIITTYTNESQMEDLQYMVHDSEILMEEIEFSEPMRILCLNILLHEEPHRVEKAPWPFKKNVFNQKRAIIAFHNIVDYSFIDEAQIGTAMINEIEAKDGIITITSPHLKYFRIKVDSIYVKLEITEETAGEGSYYSIP